MEVEDLDVTKETLGQAADLIGFSFGKGYRTRYPFFLFRM